MKQNIMINIGGGLLAAVLGLTACGPNKTSLEGETDLALSRENAGIIGGQPVTATDDISKMTAQLYMFKPVVEKDKTTGKDKIVGLDTGKCTVSIVTSRLVLTAAHCVSSKNMFVYFSKEPVSKEQAGEFIRTLRTNPLVRTVVDVAIPNLQSDEPEEAKSPAQPSAGEKGEEANKGPMVDPRDTGDIALLELNAPIPEGFKTVGLLPTTFDLGSVKVLTLAGWGQTDGVLATAATTLSKVEVPLKDVNFAETEFTVGRGACHGDSGGPAYASVNGKLYVAGVTSRADMRVDPKGQCVSDAIYTKTQFYNTWLVAAGKALYERGNAAPAAPSSVAKK